MPKIFPAPLTPDIARPLLAAAERIDCLEPWTFTSDLELIGMREEATGKLHVASILGYTRDHVCGRDLSKRRWFAGNP